MDDQDNDEAAMASLRRAKQQSEFLLRMAMATLGIYAALSAMIIAKAHGML